MTPVKSRDVARPQYLKRNGRKTDLRIVEVFKMADKVIVAHIEDERTGSRIKRLLLALVKDGSISESEASELENLVDEEVAEEERASQNAFLHAMRQIVG